MTPTDTTNLLENLSDDDDIKALVEKYFGDALPESKPVYGELFSLKAKTNDNFLDWQTEVDNRATTLVEQLNQDSSSEKLAEGRAQLLLWYLRAGRFAESVFNDAAQEMKYYQRGLDYAEQFLAQRETASGVREQVLNLYFNAGFTQSQPPFNDAAQAMKYYQRGLDYAEQFLAQRETASGVREQVLRLYSNAGVAQGQPPFNDAALKMKYYQRGLDYAEQFLAQGETVPRVREQVLKLYYNAGVIQGQPPFNDAAQAMKYYQRGLDYAEQFLAQREIASGVRYLVLQLYSNAGVAQGQPPFNDIAQAFDYFQRGLHEAEQFLAQGETASGVREQVLKLYVNAGGTQSQPPFNDAAQAFDYFQRGLDYAEQFLAQGETVPRVREQVLKLYYNAGVIQGQPPFNDAAQAMKYYQRGLDYAEQFLAQRETASGVREQVLRLYSNAGVAQGQPPFNDAAQVFDYFQRGLDYAEQFLAQRETAPGVRERVLHLYYNAGVTQGQPPFNDAAQAMKYYQRGLDYAEQFLAQGETVPRVREQVLKLYYNAGVIQGQPPFNDAAQAMKYYQRGLDYAEQFLAQRETASGVREQVLRLYSNAGVAQGQPPFNDAAQVFDYFQRGLDYAEQFLAQGETASGVRKLVLKLYVNAGLTQSQPPFNDAAQQMKYYQRGLDYAEQFLAQGETASGVREPVLELYDGISVTLAQSRQTGLSTQSLPISAFWTWTSFSQVQQPHIKHMILNNWRIHLGTTPDDTDITTGFQQLLHHLLFVWHDPNRPHRHFVTTETLLALSETLYGLEQAQENRRLYKVYERLQDLHHSPTVQYAQQILKQQQTLTQQLQNRWQRLKLSPTQVDDLKALQNCSRWQTLRHWWTIRQLRQNLAAYQQLPSQAQIAEHDERWQRAVKRTETAIFEWLRDAIDNQLKLPNWLEDLAAIVLGILLANSTNKPMPESVTRTGGGSLGPSDENDLHLALILETWQHNPPWQNVAVLQTALGKSWQRWATHANSPLYRWLDSLLIYEKTPTLQRLNIALEVSNFEQPELQTWLRELQQGHASKLASKLQTAWETAQQQAQRVGHLLNALASPDDFQQLGRVLKVLATTPAIQKKVFAKHKLPPSDYRQALAAVILGDAPFLIQTAVQTWLKQQGPVDNTTPVLETLTALKHRLNRVVAVYQPRFPELANTVHDWSQVRLQELLNSSAATEEDLWYLLERARIGLAGLMLKLPDNWQKQLGRALWDTLKNTMNQILDSYVPSEYEPWQPLQIWVYKIEEWLLNPLPTIAECQQQLPPKHALVQPFLDPIQHRYRLLWLDNNGLQLKDLPDDGALESHWTENHPDSVISKWTHNLKQWQAEYERGGLSNFGPEWEQVMKSTPVQHFANTLSDWATDYQQLTVIWPAPIGQLPWEILPALEPKCVREISVAHWLKSRQPAQDTPIHRSESQPANWVSCDPAGQPFCMVSEASWVAQQQQTQLEAPCPSVFDALHHLAQTLNAHLAMHGQFNRHNPLASGLTLSDQTANPIELPLWTLTNAPVTADLIVLSACESNLSGQDTEGLLTPIGIGPSLAAAGAKTVVGTLWPCHGLAALCFSHYLYQLMAHNPNTPWHLIVAEARQALQAMTHDHLETVVKTFNLEGKCYNSVEIIKALSRRSKRPFKKFPMWAGFSVLGQNQR
jgi:hypothetical protein